VSGRAPVVWLQLVLLDGAHPAKPEKLGAKDLKITGSQKGSKRYLFLKKNRLEFPRFPFGLFAVQLNPQHRNQRRRLSIVNFIWNERLSV